MKALKIIGWVLTGVAAIAALALALGVPVMLLWNWLMPALFELPRITYWQSIGLLVLCHILFGGHAARAHHRADKKPRHPHDFAAHVAALFHGRHAHVAEEPPQDA